MIQPQRLKPSDLDRRIRLVFSQDTDDTIKACHL